MWPGTMSTNKTAEHIDDYRYLGPSVTSGYTAPFPYNNSTSPDKGATGGPSFTHFNTSDNMLSSTLHELGSWPSSSMPTSSRDAYTDNTLNTSSYMDPSSTTNAEPSYPDWDMGWLGSGGIPSFPVLHEDSIQTEHIDAVIDEAWRMIMGDPKFTNAGIDEQRPQR